MWRWILFFLPKNLISYLFGYFSHMKKPRFLIRFVIHSFAKIYQINLNEMKTSHLDDFKCLDDFFTRELKSELRPIKGLVVHPVDAYLSQSHKINEGKIIQAKNKFYSSYGLTKIKLYKSTPPSYALTYYLCPTDYHRVHCPTQSQLLSYRYIPGTLWPVNPWSVEHISQVFNRNERLVFYFNSQELGNYSLVMVGATNVGKMSLSFLSGSFSTNRLFNRKEFVKNLEVPIDFECGEEIGQFHLGSTVVILLDQVKTALSIPKEGQSVKLGEKW